VIASGRQYSVREFVARAVAHLGMDIRWQGEGVDEQGIDTASGRCIVAVDPRYFRPTEVETLLGDPGKAREKLGWVAKTSFDRLVEEMVVEDLKLAERDHMVNAAGYRAYTYHE
jgi:GDPmannose 4,6-dehydratase